MLCSRSVSFTSSTRISVDSASTSFRRFSESLCACASAAARAVASSLLLLLLLLLSPTTLLSLSLTPLTPPPPRDEAPPPPPPRPRPPPRSRERPRYRLLLALRLRRCWSRCCSTAAISMRLSLVTPSTMRATSAPALASMYSEVAPVSSTVSCSSPVTTDATSILDCASIIATSIGCVMYGSPEERICPRCSRSASTKASNTVRMSLALLYSPTSRISSRTAFRTEPSGPG